MSPLINLFLAIGIVAVPVVLLGILFVARGRTQSPPVAPFSPTFVPEPSELPDETEPFSNRLTGYPTENNPTQAPDGSPDSPLAEIVAQIETHSTTGHFEAVQSLLPALPDFGENEEQDALVARTLTTLIRHYSQFGAFDEAEQLLTTLMAQSNRSQIVRLCIPATATQLIKALALAGLIEPARQLRDKLLQWGEQDAVDSEYAQATVALLQAYLKHDHPDLAEQLFAELRRLPDDEAINVCRAQAVAAVIAYDCQSERIEDAKALMISLQPLDDSPEINRFRALAASHLMRACLEPARAGDLSALFDILSTGVPETLRLEYANAAAALVKALCHTNQSDAAQQLCLMLPHLGDSEELVAVRIRTLVNLTHALFTGNAVELAELKFDELCSLATSEFLLHSAASEIAECLEEAITVGDLALAEDFFSRLEELGESPVVEEIRQQAIVPLVSACIHNEALVRLEQLFTRLVEAEDSLCVECARLTAGAIGLAADTGHLPQAVALYPLLAKLGSSDSIVDYCAEATAHLMRAALQDGQLPQAERYFADLNAFPSSEKLDLIRAQATMYLIEAYGNAGQIKQASQLFATLPIPTDASLPAYASRAKQLFSIYCQAQQWDDADALFRKLCQTDDSETFRTLRSDAAEQLLRACVQAQKTDLVSRFTGDLAKSGCPSSVLTDCARIITDLIRFHIDTDQIEAAEQLFGGLIRLGDAPASAAYRNKTAMRLAVALIRHRRFNRLALLYETLRGFIGSEHAQAVCARITTSRIRALLETRHLHSAVRLFDCLRCLAPLEPISVQRSRITAQLILACHKSRKFRKASHLLNTLRDHDDSSAGKLEYVRVVVQLIIAYLKKNKLQRAERLFEEIRDLDESEPFYLEYCKAAAELIRVYGTTNQLFLAEKLFQELPRPHESGAVNGAWAEMAANLVLAYNKAGKLKEAEKLFHQIFSLETSEALSGSLLNGCARAATCLINAYVGTNKLSRVDRLLKLVSRSCHGEALETECSKALVHLIYALITSGRFESAAQLYQRFSWFNHDAITDENRTKAAVYLTRACLKHETLAALEKLFVSLARSEASVVLIGKCAKLTANTIYRLANAGQFDFAGQLLQTLPLLGNPEAISHSRQKAASYLIYACFKQNQLSRLGTLIDAWYHAEDSDPVKIKTASELVRLIRVCTRSGKVGYAEKLFSLLKRLGTSDVLAFEFTQAAACLIASYGNNNKFDEAEKCHAFIRSFADADEARSGYLEASVNLIAVRLQQHKISEARQLLDQLCTEHNLAACPGDYTRALACLIEAYADAQLWDQAENLFAEMPRPDATNEADYGEAAANLINVYITTERSNEAEALYATLPNTSATRIAHAKATASLIGVWCDAGLLEKAQAAFAELQPVKDTLKTAYAQAALRLIALYAKNAQPEPAIVLFDAALPYAEEAPNKSPYQRIASLRGTRNPHVQPQYTPVPALRAPRSSSDLRPVRSFPDSAESETETLKGELASVANTLLSVCLAQQKPEPAEHLFSALRSFARSGIGKTGYAQALAPLLNALVDANHLSSVETLFSEARELCDNDVLKVELARAAIPYLTVLLKHNHVDQAEKLFNEMKECGNQQTIHDACIDAAAPLTDALCKNDRIDRAVQIVEAIRTFRDNEPQILAINKITTSLINACLGKRKYGQAEKLFDAMLASGNSEAIALGCAKAAAFLVFTLGKSGRLNTAVKLCDTVRALGNSPQLKIEQARITTILIHACINRGRPERARQVFETLPPLADTDALRITCAHALGLLINAYVRIGHPDVARQLFLRLSEFGNTSEVRHERIQALSGLIRLCCKTGQADLAEQLFEELKSVAPSIIHNPEYAPVVTDLIRTLATNQRLPRIAQLFTALSGASDIFKAHCARAAASLIGDYTKAGNGKLLLAERLFSTMKSLGKSRALTAEYTNAGVSLYQTYLKTGKMNKARRLLERLPKVSIQKSGTIRRTSRDKVRRIKHNMACGG